MNKIYKELFGKSYRLSYSSMKKLEKSIDHLIEYRRNPPEPTEDMAFGTAYHCAILEPEKFSSEYCCLPPVPDFPQKSKNQPLTIADQKAQWIKEQNPDN